MHYNNIHETELENHFVQGSMKSMALDKGDTVMLYGKLNSKKANICDCAVQIKRGGVLIGPNLFQLQRH